MGIVLRSTRSSSATRSRPTFCGLAKQSSLLPSSASLQRLRGRLRYACLQRSMDTKTTLERAASFLPSNGLPYKGTESATRLGFSGHSCNRKGDTSKNGFNFCLKTVHLGTTFIRVSCAHATKHDRFWAVSNKGGERHHSRQLPSWRRIRVDSQVLDSVG